MSPAATRGKVDLDKTREALLGLGMDFAAESLHSSCLRRREGRFLAVRRLRSAARIPLEERRWLSDGTWAGKVVAPRQRKEPRHETSRKT